MLCVLSCLLVFLLIYIYMISFEVFFGGGPPSRLLWNNLKPCSHRPLSDSFQQWKLIGGCGKTSVKRISLSMCMIEPCPKRAVIRYVVSFSFRHQGATANICCFRCDMRSVCVCKTLIPNADLCRMSFKLSRRQQNHSKPPIGVP